MRSGSKNDQRGSGRSVQGTGGWGQPSVQEAIPRQGPGFLALLPGAFENVVPELAQLDAQGVAAVDQDTSQPVPPLLEHPAELLETDFAAMLLPADRARVRVPPEDEDCGEEACPDFTLHAARVGTFGDIQAQGPFALAEDEFNLPAEAVEVRPCLRWDSRRPARCRPALSGLKRKATTRTGPKRCASWPQ